MWYSPPTSPTTGVVASCLPVRVRGTDVIPCHLYEDPLEVKRRSGPIHLSELGSERGRWGPAHLGCVRGVRSRLPSQRIGPLADDRAVGPGGTRARPFRTRTSLIRCSSRVSAEVAGLSRVTRPSAAPSSGGTAHEASGWPPPQRSQSWLCHATPAWSRTPATAARTAAAAAPPRSPRS